MSAARQSRRISSDIEREKVENALKLLTLCVSLGYIPEYVTLSSKGRQIADLANIFESIEVQLAYLGSEPEPPTRFWNKLQTTRMEAELCSRVSA